MTAQIPDEFRYEGEEYALVGMNGEGLFTPQDFGLTPRMASTACWRGYVMKYDCLDGQLVLDGMDVNSDTAPPINGVDPIDGTREVGNEQMRYRMFKFTYEKLGLKTKFTGSMLLAKDFIDSMYVHMGFQRPMAFRTVLELQVQDGDIISMSDLSEKMEELRLMSSEKGARPPTDHESDVREWIEETFSLDYDIE